MTYIKKFILNLDSYLIRSISNKSKLIKLQNSDSLKNKRDDDKLVTVMMLSYNNIEYMIGAIDSVLNQNYSEIELIINDDASDNFSDKYKNYIKEYIEKNKKDNLRSYIIESNLQNVGIIKSYNKVINLSCGRYLIPLCCDDEFYDNNVITNIVDYFNTHDELIATGYRVCYDDNLISELKIEPSQSDIQYLYKSPIDLYRRLCRSNFIAGACTSYTREFINKYGLFDENYKLIEDWSKYLNITRKGCSIGFIDKKLIKYRHGGITTGGANPRIKQLIRNDVYLIRKKEISPYQ